LQRVWSYYYSFFDGGMAVADISEDNGLEILANSFCDLMVLNRTGDLVWSFDAGVGGCGTYYKSALQSPVVADITPENSGLENTYS
jgi:outer membrane protein assembly factor BamB